MHCQHTIVLLVTLTVNERLQAVDCAGRGVLVKETTEDCFAAFRIGSEAGGGALMELKMEEDDDWDDDQAAPLPTLPQKQEEHRAPWQRTGQQPNLNFPNLPLPIHSSLQADLHPQRTCLHTSWDNSFH